MNFQGQWHQTKGYNQLIAPHLRYQRKQIRAGVWRPVLLFPFFMLWVLVLISSVCQYFGIK